MDTSRGRGREKGGVKEAVQSRKKPPKLDDLGWGAPKGWKGGSGTPEVYDGRLS